ncbi:MAG TPA: PorP/SprF family type IX secretion system membrane protein [Saprospiraceae bacterium]|mgnify:CR=1 FL=1|jgi:type IX secretion system PorP/SprF family membrane protein|nr:PorP/SprF family type IX secretion system membrane protein [Saprospiraceae bacterium]HRO09743.1 PorP/SprF family type IX secretion system membrane protein [Saprospiraceae bacterium]HRP42988.1 PorP/SprF family type IX secretion system membrane protein [Saprospiraceae bacterium]
MNRVVTRIGVLLFMVITLQVSAQDIHFTQFYMSPLNLNPALTGVMNCRTRMVANYRNQWSAILSANAYNTYSVSYDQKIPVGREDYFGIGGSIWGDVAGESRFGTTQGRVSLSYSKKMAGYRKKASYLVLGADAGLANRGISNQDLRWPTQITSEGFDPTIEPGENLTDLNFLYADLSAGFLWFSIIDSYTNWYFGAAIAHLNKPNVSFLGNDADLYAKYTIHGGVQFELQKRISLLPFAVYMAQGPHRSFNGGANLRFAMGPSRTTNQSWEIGTWYRVGNKVPSGLHSDAVILSTRFNYEEFGIGFSYDINVSGLRQASPANGAFEFSLLYNICGPENRGVYCPRF